MAKFAIDAGHGGSDPGAVGPGGLHEADVNLSVSNHLVAGLVRLDLSTLLTRKTDDYVSLGARCEIANDWGADFFVSIHCNSNGSSAVGVETLYKTAKGEALALPIQEAMVEATGDVDRGLKYRSDLYVLNATRMPATLAEIGFISHPDTEALLKTDNYRKLIADAIAVGITKHLNIHLPHGEGPK
jgi:N-acetylmuramoyl-L-alanine amidase